MLVLSRKRNESVVVNDSVVISVLEIRGDKVRLGFQGPKETPIHRLEIWTDIHKCLPEGFEQVRGTDHE